jgi:NTP pyrophosphatase (non-canonical NTP hydrolase)
MMDLKDIQAAQAEFSKRKFPNVKPDLNYYGWALTGEWGEFSNKIKKVMRDHRGSIPSPEFLFDLGMELADVLISLVCVATALDIELDDFYQFVTQRNESRWPDASGPDQSDLKSAVQQRQQGPSGVGAFVAEAELLDLLQEPLEGELPDPRQR